MPQDLGDDDQDTSDSGIVDIRYPLLQFVLDLASLP